MPRVTSSKNLSVLTDREVNFNLLRSVSQKLREKGIINEYDAIDYLASKGAQK
jgi:hypothetical protein